MTPNFDTDGLWGYCVRKPNENPGDDGGDPTASPRADSGDNGGDPKPGTTV